jgi:hypothetical protein
VVLEYSSLTRTTHIELPPFSSSLLQLDPADSASATHLCKVLVQSSGQSGGGGGGKARAVTAHTAEGAGAGTGAGTGASALAACMRAVELDGEDFAARTWLGQLHLARGEFSASARHLRQATLIAPGRPEGFFQLATAILPFDPELAHDLVAQAAVLMLAACTRATHGQGPGQGEGPGEGQRQGGSSDACAHVRDVGAQTRLLLASAKRQQAVVAPTRVKAEL